MESTQQKRRMPRPSQPKLDPVLVVRGAEFAKNRAKDVGQPQSLIVVDDVVDVGGTPFVHYHYKASGRHDSMILKDFCAGSEHRLPDPPAEPVEEPPQSGERETEHEPTLRDVYEQGKATHMMMAEVLRILKTMGPRQLELTGTK